MLLRESVSVHAVYLHPFVSGDRDKERVELDDIGHYLSLFSCVIGFHFPICLAKKKFLLFMRAWMFSCQV